MQKRKYIENIKRSIRKKRMDILYVVLDLEYVKYIYQNGHTKVARNIKKLALIVNEEKKKKSGRKV